MAVRAPHITFLDLSDDVSPTRVVAHQINDRSALVVAMVKLEHDGVGFTAIHARMCQQVVPSLASCFERDDAASKV